MYVLIATASEPGELQPTLASLAACTLPTSYRGLIVVENGARRGAEGAIKACPAHLRAAYRYCEPAGKCNALNTALREIASGPCVFLDDDVRVAPDTLTAYAQAIAESPHCYYGGRCHADYESPPSDHIRNYLPASAKGWEPHGDYGSGRPMIFLGFNWATDASDILAAGGFPEHIGPGQDLRIGDEDAVQLALIERGLAARYVPGAEAWHRVPASRCSEAWLIDRAYHNGRSRAALRPLSGPTLAGLPYSLRRRQLTAGIRSALAVITRRPNDVFYARLAQQINRGLRDGHREAHRNKNGLAAPAAPTLTARGGT